LGTVERMDKQDSADAVEDRLHLLFVQGLAGDAAAYQAFLKEVSGYLRAFLGRRLSQLPDEVEDLVQETLLAIHLHRHTYRPEQPLTSWVYTIARYKMVDLLRSRARREALHDPLDAEQELFAASTLEAADARHDLAKLLKKLPPSSRLALAATRLHELSVAEAARATGMSEPAIKTGVHRGLKALSAMVRGKA